MTAPDTLTDAQRRALMWLPADGSLDLVEHRDPIMFELFDAGLAGRLWDGPSTWFWCLTPSGIALRAKLEAADG